MWDGWLFGWLCIAQVFVYAFLCTVIYNPSLVFRGAKGTEAGLFEWFILVVPPQILRSDDGSLNTTLNPQTR